MRIGINLLPYHYGGQGGAEVYIRNLLHALAGLADDSEYFLFVNSRGKPDYQFGDRFQCIELPTMGRNPMTRSLLEQVQLPYEEQKLRLDVLFSNYVIPISPGGCVRMVAIHDMLYQRFPQFLQPSKRWWWRQAIPLSVRRSDLVITVSNASKSDIVEAFGLPENRIMVQSEGVDLELQRQCPDSASIQRTLAKLGVTEPFILSAATFGPQKNIPRLLEAFQIVRSQTGSIKLVLTGRFRGFSSDVANDLLKDVILTGYITISELADLYASATAHVLPSIFEGFGLSILEAQYFGCPVATSSASAPAEVAGQSAILFNPWDVHDMAEALLTVVNDPLERIRLIKLGHDNVQRYSWQLAATQFHEACRLATENRGWVR
jgi:glycosyltransferase involved in cell wall biosynthesis